MYSKRQIMWFCLCAAVASALMLAGCATDSDTVVVSSRRSGNGTKLKVSGQKGVSAPAADNASSAIKRDKDSPDSRPSAMPSAKTTTRPAVSGEVTIQPDSLVQIKVKEDPDLDDNYPVNDIGAIEFKYVGPVILYNMNEKAAEKKIQDVLENRYFQSASVTVKILRPAYDRIQVAGAVNKPGMIRIGAGDSVSLNDALLRAGGLKPSAKGARVRVARGGLISAVSPLTAGGEEYSLVGEDGVPVVPAIYVKNNDVIYVFSTDAEASVELGEKEVLVIGEVIKPGFVKFSVAEPCTLMHLVLKIGGLPQYANKKAIRVVRRDKDGGEEEFKVNLEAIMDDGDPDKDFPLENGDRVIVPARRISLFN